MSTISEILYQKFHRLKKQFARKMSMVVIMKKLTNFEMIVNKNNSSMFKRIN